MLSSQWKFQSLAKPYHWWLTAASMKDAAELIFQGVDTAQRKPSAEHLDMARQGYELAHPSHDLRSVYALLAGFSLENLFKAEYMRRNAPNLDDGKLPSEIIKGHKLRELCKLAAFEPKADEEGMLEDASRAIISWGRYPGGLRHDQGGMHAPECFDLEEFRRAFEAVYWRLTEVITDGWNE